METDPNQHDAQLEDPAEDELGEEALDEELGGEPLEPGEDQAGLDEAPTGP